MNAAEIDAAFAAFGRWCFESMREPAPGDIDGGDAQDEAIRLGLLVEVTMDKPCCEDCLCVEYHGSDGFPVRCLVPASLPPVPETRP